MIALFGSLAGLFLYFEIIYHLSGYGFTACMPVYVIFLIITWAGIWSLVVGSLRGVLKKIAFYTVVWFSYLWFGAQVVYLQIFKQPLLWQGVFQGGKDALTNYWKETLLGILRALPILLLAIVPCILFCVLLHRKKWKLPRFRSLQYLQITVFICVGIAGEVVTMEIGRAVEAEYYENYVDFYDPLTVAENMGFLPMLQRDTQLEIANGVENTWKKLFKTEKNPDEEPYMGSVSGSDLSGSVNPDEEDSNADSQAGEGLPADGTGEGNGTEGDGTVTELPKEPPKPQFNELTIDFDAIRAGTTDEKKLWLADYIEGLQPTNINEYTGFFKDYNLIYLTAEGFSPYAVREDLTPTLYRLVNSGFVFNNYYTPIWQTSTSDGEYINCTGLIPDGQFSMRKSSDILMAYTLPNFFAKEGVASKAYHDNSLSYYDRNRSHPNMGYDFKGCKLGNLSEEEWGDKIFPMEHPNSWPASDYEMMQGTIPEYINEERFHVYYMTVSGHMNYDFKGNAMSGKNKELVEQLPMSENARAYIACQIELDRALQYLLEQLEAAGKLENTVICLSTDHYPYGMTLEQYEELAGKPLSEGEDMYRNNLILWNSQMEAEPVYVDKVCGPMDIIPTLLNLFGFSYDSRMYAGRDIFSDEPGLVIFNDRSFVTDDFVYRKKPKEIRWTEGNTVYPELSEEQIDYVEVWKKEVKDRYQFSAYILQSDFYRDVVAATLPVSE